jgi:hypothetical protein
MLRPGCNSGLQGSACRGSRCAAGVNLVSAFSDSESGATRCLDVLQPAPRVETTRKCVGSARAAGRPSLPRARCCLAQRRLPSRADRTLSRSQATRLTLHQRTQDTGTPGARVPSCASPRSPLRRRNSPPAPSPNTANSGPAARRRAPRHRRTCAGRSLGNTRRPEARPGPIHDSMNSAS